MTIEDELDASEMGQGHPTIHVSTAKADLGAPLGALLPGYEARPRSRLASIAGKFYTMIRQKSKGTAPYSALTIVTIANGKSLAKSLTTRPMTSQRLKSSVHASRRGIPSNRLSTNRLILWSRT